MAEPTPPSPMDEPTRRLAIPLVLAFWTFIALLSAANLWLATGNRPGPGPPPGAYLVGFIEAYLWALLTLGVFWLCARLSTERGDLLGTALLLLAAGLAVAIGMAAVMGRLRPWLEGPPPLLPGGRPPRPGMPWAPRPRPFPDLAHLWFLNELITYAALVGAGFAREYFLRFQARQAEAVRLQAQTATLSAQLADARLTALRAQLDPHFLFNTLNAISALVERDPDGVQRMIARLSELLRHTLDGSERQEVPLSEEVALVRRYLEIMEVRFQGRLAVSLQVEPSLGDALVPSLILQPLVENAIKHGISRRPGPARIEISARSQDDQLRLRVWDDGDGSPAENPEGVGLANTRERLRQLYGEGARLRAEPAPEGGFASEVTIPWRPEAG
jgi:two-component system LytT family sensor kinase